MVVDGESVLVIDGVLVVVAGLLAAPVAEKMPWAEVHGPATGIVGTVVVAAGVAVVVGAVMILTSQGFG